jgi:hypothetical protein
MNTNAPAMAMTITMARTAIAVNDGFFFAGGRGVPGTGSAGGVGGEELVSGDREGTGESAVNRTGHLMSGVGDGEEVSSFGSDVVSADGVCHWVDGDWIWRDGTSGEGSVRGTESSISGSME